MAEDESSVSKQEFRYKWTFPAPGVECVLRWHEVEYDADDVFVASVARSFHVRFGMTETPVYQVLAPTASGNYIVIEQP